MRRGFKTWAEQQAVQQRRVLGLSAVAPLAAERLAAHHDIDIRSPLDIPGMFRNTSGDVVAMVRFDDGTTAEYIYPANVVDEGE